MLARSSASRWLAIFAMVMTQTLAGNGRVAAEEDATRIGRSSVAKAPEFQELYDYDAAAKPRSEATFPYESRVHRAHVVMLAEQEIV